MKKLLFALLIMAIAFSAFAGGNKEKAAPAKAAPAATAAPVKAEPVVFKFNNGTEPQSLDPAEIQGVPEHNVYMSLFEGLVTYNPKTLAAEPGLAKSWDKSSDGLTWTFHLRKTNWSDGTPITAQQVVDSWLRFLNPKTAAVYAYLPGMIIKGAADYNAGKTGPESVAIKALDDYTFQFTLNGPAPYALGMLSHYAFAVVPLQTIAKYGTKWTRPENIVTNGPFKLVEWTPHDKIVMEKNPEYWDAGNVKIDKLIFYPIEDENTALNMYKQGSLDWIQTVPDAQLDQMKLDPTYHVNAAFITYYYEFNTTKKPFNNPDVRKALSMAINRQELVDKVTRGGQFPAFGLTPPLADYPAVVAFKEDPAKAKELLAKAGYPNGKGFPKTTILYNTSEGHKKIAEYVQQKWKEVLNINVSIENQEWATYLDNRQHQNFDVCRAGWQGDYVDPNTFLTDLLQSKAGNNDGRYSNPKYDALLAKAAKLPDGKERMGILRQAEELAIGQDMAVMPFYYYTTSNWINTNVWGGWYTNILDVHPFKDIYKK